MSTLGHQSDNSLVSNAFGFLRFPLNFMPYDSDAERREARRRRHDAEQTEPVKIGGYLCHGNITGMDNPQHAV